MANSSKSAGNLSAPGSADATGNSTVRRLRTGQADRGQPSLSGWQADFACESLNQIDDLAYLALREIREDGSSVTPLLVRIGQLVGICRSAIGDAMGDAPESRRELETAIYGYAPREECGDE